MNNLSAFSKQFIALGNAQRLKILNIIIDEAQYCDLDEIPVISENTSKALIKLTRLSPATLTHHINILKNAALIREEKKGKFKFLFPGKDTLESIKTILNIETIEKKTIRFPHISLYQDKFFELIDYLRIHSYRFKKPAIKENQLRFYSAKKDFIVVYSTTTSKVYIIKLSGELNTISEVMNLIEKFASVKKNQIS
ncbi:MAG: hypothetical protein WCJ58_07905 [bacterium]